MVYGAARTMSFTQIGVRGGGDTGVKVYRQIIPLTKIAQENATLFV